jgi:uncharacterized protein
MNLTLSVLPGRYAICRLNAGEPIPAWSPLAAGPPHPGAEGFVSITRTGDELSIVGPEAGVPEGVRRDCGWRIFKVQGPLDLSLTGVSAALAVPLADARINIFAVSTFDTDYLLVKEELLSLAVETLIRAGHQIEHG